MFSGKQSKSGARACSIGKNENLSGYSNAIHRCALRFNFLFILLSVNHRPLLANSLPGSGTNVKQSKTRCFAPPICHFLRGGFQLAHEFGKLCFAKARCESFTNSRHKTNCAAVFRDNFRSSMKL